MHSFIDFTINWAVYLPLILLAFGNLHIKTEEVGVTVDIGNISCPDETRFAFQFPSMMPIIDIEI